MTPPVFKWYGRFGRLQLALTVFRHRYPTASDRWVFQPHVIYDRRQR